MGTDYSINSQAHSRPPHDVPPASGTGGGSCNKTAVAKTRALRARSERNSQGAGYRMQGMMPCSFSDSPVRHLRSKHPRLCSLHSIRSTFYPRLIPAREINKLHYFVHYARSQARGLHDLAHKTNRHLGGDFPSSTCRMHALIWLKTCSETNCELV